MKTTLHFTRLLAGLLFVSLPFFSVAQTITLDGRCIAGPINLPQGSPANGKNTYEVVGTYQGVPGTTFSIVWSSVDMLWFLQVDGTPIFSAASSTGGGQMNPPPTSAWTSLGSGTPEADCMDAEPLSVTGDAILPVELLAFGAKMTTPNKVQIAWQVAQEQQLLGYEILKSQNASDWQSIAFLKAQNRTDKTNYEYYDLQPTTNITYYQLRSINNDATFRLSAIVSVNGSTAKQTPLYSPNPTSGRLNLPLSTSVQTTVFDMTGKLLLQNNGNTELDISAFPKGTYILKMQAEGTVWQQKITKI